jgi:hypothetical protein
VTVDPPQQRPGVVLVVRFQHRPPGRHRARRIVLDL